MLIVWIGYNKGVKRIKRMWHWRPLPWQPKTIESKIVGLENHHHHLALGNIFILGQTSKESSLKNFTLHSPALRGWIKIFREGKEPWY